MLLEGFGSFVETVTAMIHEGPAADVDRLKRPSRYGGNRFGSTSSNSNGIDR